MLDIKFIRENLEEIKEAAKNKKISLDFNRLLELDGERRELLAKIEELRTRRNKIALAGKKVRPTPAQIKEGKKIKSEISGLEDRFNLLEGEYEDLMVKVPTITSKDTPIGKDERGNLEVGRWGKLPEFNFKPRSYLELAEDLDLLDLKRGTKVAGYRGYYVKNELASLELALMMYAFNELINLGYTPMIPPTLVREFALFGSGYFAGRHYNPETDEIYKIANGEKLADGTIQKEDKFLIGTAEPSLLAYYADEILDEKELPIKFCGFSQCYRSEIGSYGKDTKGIYRVHEFMKVEQVCLTRADIGESDKIQQEMLAISKKMHEELNLPYRQIHICTGDLSAGKYKMFDLEAWIPSRKGYGETGSASNFLDWQSRRLNVKYKDGKGNKKFVYMLNNTALPTARPLIAILENYQQADGSVVVPEALRKYMPGNIEIIKRKS